MQVAGSVVFITGGASGIGAAMAGAFAAAGARTVVVADIDETGARAVASAIGGRAIALDVTDEAATAAAIRDVEAEFGSIDVLCVNAGIATGGSVDTDDELWQRTWEVNVMAHVYAVRHALGGMLERGSGHIVSTASAAGLLTSLGAAPYAVTKHAAVALAEWLAITYGDRGIGVSCVCPQFVDTPMLEAFAGGSEAMRAWVGDIAITPEEVAAQVVDAVEAGTFLVLPHPEVAGYVAGRAADHERWIAGMRKLQASLDAPRG
jgi:NAD(P)-dependent dehydrogenase (short-subunit alcohol dehydrogenase family)